MEMSMTAWLRSATPAAKNHGAALKLAAFPGNFALQNSSYSFDHMFARSVVRSFHQYTRCCQSILSPPFRSRRLLGTTSPLSMPSKDKYTDPELRDQVKEGIHQSDEGGAPGQWSARKAQMMASEYKKRGGGYTTDKKDQDESQQHLSKWGEEEWQTKEGSPNAKQEDGTQKRYLPKKAWENMSEEEKQATDEKKQKESKQGKQFVGNTKKAKESRQQANKEEDKKYAKKEEEAAAEDGEQEDGGKEVDDDESAEDEEYVEEDGEDDEVSEEDESADEEEKDDSLKGKKRTRSSKPDSPANKKQKSNSGKGRQNGSKQNGSRQNGSKQNGNKQNGTVGSRHDKADAPAEQGSNGRLPEEGKQVHWKAMPGWIDGEVVEIVTKQKKVEGKQIKASEDESRIVLKSNSSGKICVHKPDNIYFD